MAKIRALEEKHEQRPQDLIRDTHTLWQRFYGVLSAPETAAMSITVIAAMGIVMPATADLCLLLGLTNFFICYFHKTQLPYRMPKRAKLLDYNDPKAGSNKPNMARGICYFGNEISTGRELWFNNDDMRTHVLIFGSTGSGKTEALVSLSYSALLQGSGFIYVDGKGDNSLYAKIFSLARTMGREDDLLLINFMTGARDIVGPQKTRISNTMNPFARGSSSMLTQLVVSMMDSSSASPDGDMWKGRAISFVEALMKILVYMRDRGDLLLDANTVRQYFALTKLESIALDKKFPLPPDDRLAPIDEAPDVVLEPIANYLATLPGFNKAKKGNQAGEVLEQHGFITMQLTRVFTSLADTYGHIIRTNLAEVDFKDVVLNRRVLVVLLPALEKSPEELSNLGKVIVASLKAMMASGLGEEVEGTYQQVIERKPTNSPTPFLCVLDEYGYYAVKGFAVVPAQARSLGFSAIFAGQDLPAFEKASKEEAASIGANTNIKICMKMEDPTTTFEFFQKTAGQAYVTRTSGFQTNANSMTNSYLDTRGAQVEKQERIDLLDLKDQREGEAHIFFKSRIVRAKLFYANPPAAKVMKLNQFLKIDKPADDIINELDDRLYKIEHIFANPEFLEAVPPLDEDLQLIRDALNHYKEAPPVERCLYSFIALYQQEAAQEEEAFATQEPEDESFKGMDILTQPPTQMPDFDNFDPLSLLNMPALMGALLDRRETVRNIEKIERFSGSTKAQSSEIAQKLIHDLRIATHYPPDVVQKQSPEDVVDAIHYLINHFKTVQEQKQQAEQDTGGDEDEIV